MIETKVRDTHIDFFFMGQMIRFIPKCVEMGKISKDTLIAPDVLCWSDMEFGSVNSFDANLDVGFYVLSDF